MRTAEDDYFNRHSGLMFMARFMCAHGVVKERCVERAEVTSHRRIAFEVDQD